MDKHSYSSNFRPADTATRSIGADSNRLHVVGGELVSRGI